MVKEKHVFPGWHVTKGTEEEDEPGETRRGHQAAEAVLLEMAP